MVRELSNFGLNQHSRWWQQAQDTQHQGELEIATIHCLFCAAAEEVAKVDDQNSNEDAEAI